MKVRMIQCQAGVDFVRNPGDVLDVPDAEAARMIEAGIATPLRDPPVETTTPVRAAETTSTKRKKG
ncbi:MAG: hypothetical protein FD152_2214 [Xanthobacteraceae bacterium]|nr:MAG: hypothetical protein FD152_2214 [Xanthobacteraceae bacterium]